MFQFDNTHFLSRCRLAVVSFCLLAVFATTTVLADEFADEEPTENTRKPYKPKLWWLKETQIFGVTLPLSPISIFTLTLLTIHFVLNWGTYAWCEASHILLKSHSKEAKIAMKELKEEIGSDYNKFMEMAKAHSDCPSGRKFIFCSCLLVTNDFY